MADGNISVKYGQLTEPLKTFGSKPGVELGKFLKVRDIEYAASIRVNGDAVKQSYVVKNGDIITNIENVSGGSL